MGRRHAKARWSPWDLLAGLTNHTQELQGTSRDTATTVVVVVAVAVAVTMQPLSKKDTQKPDSRMELASCSNG